MKEIEYSRYNLRSSKVSTEKSLQGNAKKSKKQVDIRNIFKQFTQNLSQTQKIIHKKNCKFGHPKFYKLQEILADHFETHDANSKVIVFCEYKDTVSEIYASLLEQRAIKPKMFMGQSSITQKQQVSIIDSFRGGRFNTLISTCIGEEGIDVGFVDMVVCFDISNKSSVRFIQRIGRTGRDRNGRVVILVAEGREHQVLQECLLEKKHLCDTLTHSKNISDKLYQNDPKMIPDGVTPECQELNIVPKKALNLTNFFTSTAASSSVLETSHAQNPTEIRTVSNYIPKSRFISLTAPDASNDELPDNSFKFNKHLEAQRVAQSIKIPSSSKTNLFIDIMKEMEYSRYNLRSSKVSTEKSLQGNAKKSKKQVDIRNMFKQFAQNLSQTQKMIDKDEPGGIETLLEAKIVSLVGNSQDCRLCEKFENDVNVKRDLVPIGKLNLKINLSFDLVSVTDLRDKIDGRLRSEEMKQDDDMMSDDSFTNLVQNYSGIDEKDDKGDHHKSVSDKVSVSERFPSPSKVLSTLSSTNSGTVQTSPDLFDEDFPASSPRNISTDKWLNMVAGNENNVKDAENVNDEIVMNDIIEASPSPVINKRKASQSSMSSFRAKKRIKFNSTDILDVSFVKSTATGSKVPGTECLDANFMESSLKGKRTEGRTATTPATASASRVSKKQIVGSEIVDVNFMQTSLNETRTSMNETRSKLVLKRSRKKITLNEIIDVSVVNFGENTQNREIVENIIETGNTNSTNIEKVQTLDNVKRKSQGFDKLGKDLSILHSESKSDQVFDKGSRNLGDRANESTSFNNLRQEKIGIIQPHDIFDSFVENANRKSESIVQLGAKPTNLQDKTSESKNETGSNLEENVGKSKSVLRRKRVGIVQSQDIFDCFVENVSRKSESFAQSGAKPTNLSDKTTESKNNNDFKDVLDDSVKNPANVRNLRKKKIGTIQSHDILDGFMENVNRKSESIEKSNENTNCESKHKEIATSSNNHVEEASSSQDSDKLDALSQDFSSYSFIPPAAPQRKRTKKKLTPLDIFDLDKSGVNLSALKKPFASSPKPLNKPPDELEPCASSLISLSMESLRSLDSEDLPSSGTSCGSLSSIEKVARTTRRTGAKRARHFIDSEADVSSDEAASSDELANSQDDVYDASFVDDEASIMPCTQMQAVYMQSVRSPVRRGQPLRRPAARHVDDTMRMNETVDLTYVKDSFCIPDDFVELQSESESLDELERAELELKRRRRNRGNRRGKGIEESKESKENNVGKRKRVLRIDSDSD